MLLKGVGKKSPIRERKKTGEAEVVPFKGVWGKRKKELRHRGRNAIRDGRDRIAEGQKKKNSGDNITLGASRLGKNLRF